MSEIFLTIILVVGTFIVVIAAYRFFVGYYPGSKFIIEDPPIPGNGLDPDQARFIFFYTTWCPWSRKAQKPWKSFKQMMKNNPATYGGKTILFEEVDAEADKGKAALYNVKEYPTFKLETSDKLVTLLAIPDPTTFKVFLKGVLGQEASS
jgi:thiol-disulfide isomerase/thioredoxin